MCSGNLHPASSAPGIAPTPGVSLNCAGGGGGYTCPAAKFLAHLTPRTPDLSHLISPLHLFYRLFAFMHLTQSNPTLTAIKLVMHTQLQLYVDNLIYRSDSMQCLHEVCRSSWRYTKPSFDQVRVLTRNFLPLSQMGMVHPNHLLTWITALLNCCH